MQELLPASESSSDELGDDGEAYFSGSKPTLTLLDVMLNSPFTPSLADMVQLQSRHPTPLLQQHLEHHQHTPLLQQRIQNQHRLTSHSPAAVFPAPDGSRSRLLALQADGANTSAAIGSFAPVPPVERVASGSQSSGECTSSSDDDDDARAPVFNLLRPRATKPHPRAPNLRVDAENTGLRQQVSGPASRPVAAAPSGGAPAGCPTRLPLAQRQPSIQRRLLEECKADQAASSPSPDAAPKASDAVDAAPGAAAANPAHSSREDCRRGLAVCGASPAQGAIPTGTHVPQVAEGGGEWGALGAAASAVAVAAPATGAAAASGRPAAAMEFASRRRAPWQARPGTGSGRIHASADAAPAQANRPQAFGCHGGRGSGSSGGGSSSEEASEEEEEAPEDVQAPRFNLLRRARAPAAAVAASPLEADRGSGGASVSHDGPTLRAAGTAASNAAQAASLLLAPWPRAAAVGSVGRVGGGNTGSGGGVSSAVLLPLAAATWQSRVGTAAVAHGGVGCGVGNAVAAAERVSGLPGARSTDGSEVRRVAGRAVGDCSPPADHAPHGTGLRPPAGRARAAASPTAAATPAAVAVPTGGIAQPGSDAALAGAIQAAHRRRRSAPTPFQSVFGDAGRQGADMRSAAGEEQQEWALGAGQAGSSDAASGGAASGGGAAATASRDGPGMRGAAGHKGGSGSDYKGDMGTEEEDLFGEPPPSRRRRILLPLCQQPQGQELIPPTGPTRRDLASREGPSPPGGVPGVGGAGLGFAGSAGGGQQDGGLDDDQRRPYLQPRRQRLKQAGDADLHPPPPSAPQQQPKEQPAAPPLPPPSQPILHPATQPALHGQGPSQSRRPAAGPPKGAQQHTATAAAGNHSILSFMRRAQPLPPLAPASAATSPEDPAPLKRSRLRLSAPPAGGTPAAPVTIDLASDDCGDARGASRRSSWAVGGGGAQGGGGHATGGIAPVVILLDDDDAEAGARPPVGLGSGARARAVAQPGCRNDGGRGGGSGLWGAALLEDEEAEGEGVNAGAGPGGQPRGAAAGGVKRRQRVILGDEDSDCDAGRADGAGGSWHEQQQRAGTGHGSGQGPGPSRALMQGRQAATGRLVGCEAAAAAQAETRAACRGAHPVALGDGRRGGGGEGGAAGFRGAAHDDAEDVIEDSSQGEEDEQPGGRAGGRGGGWGGGAAGDATAGRRSLGEVGTSGQLNLRGAGVQGGGVEAQRRHSLPSGGHPLRLGLLTYQHPGLPPLVPPGNGNGAAAGGAGLMPPHQQHQQHLQLQPAPRPEHNQQQHQQHQQPWTGQQQQQQPSARPAPWWSLLPDFVPAAALAGGYDPRTAPRPEPVFILYQQQFNGPANSSVVPQHRNVAYPPGGAGGGGAGPGGSGAYGGAGGSGHGGAYGGDPGGAGGAAADTEIMDWAREVCGAKSRGGGGGGRRSKRSSAAAAAGGPSEEGAGGGGRWFTNNNGIRVYVENGQEYTGRAAYNRYKHVAEPAAEEAAGAGRGGRKSKGKRKGGRKGGRRSKSKAKATMGGGVTKKSGSGKAAGAAAGGWLGRGKGGKGK